MDKRTQKQEYFSRRWWGKPGQSGIFHLAPRFGKCAVAIKILQKYTRLNDDILITYPEVSIKDAWISEMNRLGFDYEGITFCTHISLKKELATRKFMIIIVDEIHLLSESQIGVLKDHSPFVRIMGLTGTLSSWTERVLEEELDTPVLARYSIDEAIEDGFVSDYQITVKTVGLDNRIKRKVGKKILTEKEQFDRISYVIDKLEEEQKNTKFLRLKRMRIIQESNAKIEATKELLKEFKDERVLVFSGQTKIAESLGCPFYHSGVKSDKVYEDFKKGKGDNHLAVVKIGNAGSTYKPLSRVVLNYFDSSEENLVQKINRCMGMEYDNPTKKSEIVIITTDEPVEKKWLDKALTALNPSKIKYL